MRGGQNGGYIGEGEERVRREEKEKLGGIMKGRKQERREEEGGRVRRGEKREEKVSSKERERRESKSVYFLFLSILHQKSKL